MGMINLLIFLALIVVFAAGWWCGKRWGTVQALFAELRTILRNSLNDKQG